VARFGIGPTLDRFLMVVVAVEPPAMAGGGEVVGSPPRLQLPTSHGSAGQWLACGVLGSRWDGHGVLH
jgi:hypothetical protein